MFEDFKLTVQGSPGAYKVAVEAPGGVSTAPESFVLAEDASFLATLARLQRQEEPPLEQLRAVGDALFRALFPRDALGAYLRLSAGRTLRLKLNLHPVEVARLPWELLYDKDEGAFLALRRDRPLVRTLAALQSVAPLRLKGPLRVLHVQASPLALPPLDLAASQSAVRQPLGARGEIAVLSEATPARLRSALLQGHHLLHFDGHATYDEVGQKGQLFLQDERGDPIPLSAATLGDYLSGSAVTLVVLTACETAAAGSRAGFGGLAQGLVQTTRLPAVVAMQVRVGDEAAIAFSQGFYSALATNAPLEVAITEGRLAMRELGERAAWFAPVLFLRAEDGQLFEVEQATKTARGGHQATLTDSVNAQGDGAIALGAGSTYVGGNVGGKGGRGKGRKKPS